MVGKSKKIVIPLRGKKRDLSYKEFEECEYCGAMVQGSPELLAHEEKCKKKHPGAGGGRGAGGRGAGGHGAGGHGAGGPGAGGLGAGGLGAGGRGVGHHA